MIATYSGSLPVIERKKVDTMSNVTLRQERDMEKTIDINAVQVCVVETSENGAAEVKPVSRNLNAEG